MFLTLEHEIYVQKHKIMFQNMKTYSGIWNLLACSNTVWQQLAGLEHVQNLKECSQHVHQISKRVIQKPPQVNSSVQIYQRECFARLNWTVSFVFYAPFINAVCI